MRIKEEEEEQRIIDSWKEKLKWQIHCCKKLNPQSQGLLHDRPDHICEEKGKSR